MHGNVCILTETTAEDGEAGLGIQTHPERLDQMLPWGKLIQENFAWQNEAPDS